jgi:hypothetical protein
LRSFVAANGAATQDDSWGGHGSPRGQELTMTAEAVD